MEAKKGAYEGATMFKFNDRDEWCIMIDYYGSSSVRYEPYTTTDLSKADSVKKLTSGYGRTGGVAGKYGLLFRPAAQIRQWIIIIRLNISIAIRESWKILKTRSKISWKITH